MKLADIEVVKKTLIDYYHIRTKIQKIALDEAFSKIPTIKPFIKLNFVKIKVYIYYKIC